MFESTKREVEAMIFDSRMKVITEQIVCQTCGCLIAQGFAVVGAKEIKQRKRWISNYDYVNEDYIYTPYFCKIHAPKVKK